MKYSLHMAINFKRPQAMKSLNNDLGSIPGGRKSKLSSTLGLKNPKPTEADWQGKQQMLMWSHFATKNNWQKGGGQNIIQRGKITGTIIIIIIVIIILLYTWLVIIIRL